MPRRYYAIKRELMAKGMSHDAAEERAAKIVNATLKRGEHAVGKHPRKKKQS